jgi:PilZ domain
MLETRRSRRVGNLLGAKIIFNDRASIIDCVVTNISSSGAELVFADTREIPNDFELSIPTKFCCYCARLVWRDTYGVGVEFYPDSKKRPEPGITSPSSPPSAA